jgi:putative DNA primase/helicase
MDPRPRLVGNVPRVFRRLNKEEKPATTSEHGGMTKLLQEPAPAKQAPGPNISHGIPLRLLNEDDLAAWLGLSVKTLRNWRVKGGPIPFVRLGRKAVRYREPDVLAFIEANARTSTSDPKKVKTAMPQSPKSQPCRPRSTTACVKPTPVAMKQSAPIGDGVDIAERIMRLTLDTNFKGGKHLVLGPGDEFYRYTGRVWAPISDRAVERLVLEAIQLERGHNRATVPLVSQVLRLIKITRDVSAGLLDSGADDRPIVNCLNGELWIAKNGGHELRAHRAESFLRRSVDVLYDPDAGCPEYDWALRGIFSAAERPDRMRRLWHEVSGYIIQPRRNIPIIVALYGEGANGKTSLIGTLTRLLGPELVVAQRIQDLGRNRFEIGSLAGKLLWVDDDVRAGAKLPDGTLKTISEAKILTGEMKFGPTFNFVVRTVPVLLSNHIPSLLDLSHGMTRRLIVVPFDRMFNEFDRDPDLFERIWAREMPGILNRALEGYRRLARRGFRFKLPADVRSATKRWLEHAKSGRTITEERRTLFS